MTSTELSLRDRFESIDGPTLIVNQLSYERWVEVVDIETGIAQPIGAIATSDGRHADLSAWHTGAEVEAVYFERYDATGRVSHGWVDSVSRRITQTG